MKWLVSKNCKTFALNKIPVFQINELCREIIEKCKGDKRVISMLFIDPLVYVVLADDENSCLLAGSAKLGKTKSFPSITKEIPAFNYFERELFENHGVVPEGHPWL